MPEEKHPIDDIPATPVPAPKSISTESQIMCPAVNSREKASKTGKPVSEHWETFHPVKHKNELSEADMETYFKISDDLELFHSHENELLQEYYRDKNANGSLTQEFCNKQNRYTEAWKKFNVNFEDKGKSILAIHQLLDDISDSQLRENLKKELRSLLESQKMMDFAREKLCRHFHEIQLDELIAQIKDGMSIDDIRTKLEEIVSAQYSHNCKLDELQQFSAEFIIILKKIEGRLPEGGIEYLQELLAKQPQEVALTYAERFFKITETLSPKLWKVYRLHRDGESNAKIASELECSHPHVGKMLKKIDLLFRENGLPSGITFYIQSKRLPSYVLDDDNKEELSFSEDGEQ